MTPYPNIPYSHNSLKAFECVARLMSFTLAAEELHITQSAVSRQVKQLESYLNGALVIRKHRSIALTDKGQSLYLLLAKNYGALESLITSWQEQQQKIVIRVSFSYAMRSLLPKIQALNKRYPNHEIVVIPDLEENEMLSINKGDYDLYIFQTLDEKRYRHDPDSHFLREEYMAPVCSVHLLGEDVALESILAMPRLHPTLDHSDWISWLKHIGYEEEHNVRDSTFLTLDLAMSACLSGQGATVTDLLFVLPELEKKFLVCPHEVKISHSPWKYFCHYGTRSSLVDELVEWLKEESLKETEKLKQLAASFTWSMPVD